MKGFFLLLLPLIVLLSSCGRVKKETKEVINKSGEVVGKSATEFFEGVSEGVDKTLQCEIALSPLLSDKGVRTGKFSIGNDSDGGQNNRLSLYLIFEKDFSEEIFVKIMDKQGVETGRARLQIEEKAGNAKYFDFSFDKRTYIEVKSKIIIE